MLVDALLFIGAGIIAAALNFGACNPRNSGGIPPDGAPSPPQDCVSHVTRWEQCGMEVVETSALSPAAPEILSTEATQSCVQRLGHRLVLACEEWPCIAAIVYADKESYEALECRAELSSDLMPSKVSMLKRGDQHIFVRKYWLTPGEIVDRWKDQAWAERQTAREAVLAQRILREVDDAP